MNKRLANDIKVKPTKHSIGSIRSPREQFAVDLLNAIELFVDGASEEELKRSPSIMGADNCPECGDHASAMYIQIGDHVLQIAHAFEEED